jgi:hypothetical protein
MIRTQISMTEAQAEQLRRLSVLRRRSQAALLRDALDGLLASEDRHRRIERARSAVGQFGSGTSDTAERHDDILDASFAE